MGKENYETKVCKFCQSVIPKKAKVCPVCKRTVKSHGCLIAFLVTLASIAGIIIVFAGIAALSIGGNDAIQKSVSGVSDKDEYITMDEYNQIENGMSYDEVQEIVGSSGEVTAQSGTDYFEITIVTWYGNGLAGSNANVTFTNGEVTAKAQVGLQ